jgi:hypothetical protein
MSQRRTPTRSPRNSERGAVFSVPLMDTHDGLRGFEVMDPDGYVMFFGRPRRSVAAS